VIAGREARERDAPVRPDRLTGPAIYRGGITVGIEVRAGGAGGHGQITRGRGAADREARGCRAARGHAHGSRAPAAHGAIPGDATQRDRVTAGREPGKRHASIRTDRLARSAIDRDGVPVGIDVRARRARRHRQVTGGGACGRAGDGEGHLRGASQGDEGGLRRSAAHRTVSRHTADGDDVRTRQHVVTRHAPVRCDRLALQQVEGDRVAVGVEARACGRRRDRQVTCQSA